MGPERDTLSIPSAFLIHSHSIVLDQHKLLTSLHNRRFYYAAFRRSDRPKSRLLFCSRFWPDSDFRGFAYYRQRSNGNRRRSRTHCDAVGPIDTVLLLLQPATYPTAHRRQRRRRTVRLID